MKKIIAGIGIVALALVFTGVASAATISNLTDESHAHSFAQWLINTIVSNSNNAVIDNNATATSNSGNNTITSADDQTETTLTTGGASAAVVVDNTANQNSVSEKIESANGANDSITGLDDESSACTRTEDTLTNDVTNDNDVTVDNEVSATATSGDNTVTSDDSQEKTVVTSGVTDSATGITQLFNMNIKEIIRTIRANM